jgi:hypothetical protein
MSAIITRSHEADVDRAGTASVKITINKVLSKANMLKMINRSELILVEL